MRRSPTNSKLELMLMGNHRESSLWVYLERWCRRLWRISEHFALGRLGRNSLDHHSIESSPTL